MKIEKNLNDSKLLIALEGRLDTMTVPQLEQEIKSIPDTVTELIVDLAGTEYISSSGLRALLSAYKVMRSRGGMKITNANELLKEIFDVTGFSDFLSIE